jgi:hypothetical protein
MGLASPNFQLFALTSNFFNAIYFPIFDTSTNKSHYEMAIMIPYTKKV